MNKVKAYFRLVKWKWAKSKQKPLYIEDYDDDITEFDSSPYLGWMEKERPS